MRMGIEIFSSEYEPCRLNLNPSTVLIEILGQSLLGDANNKDSFHFVTKNELQFWTENQSHRSYQVWLLIHLVLKKYKVQNNQNVKLYDLLFSV